MFHFSASGRFKTWRAVNKPSRKITFRAGYRPGLSSVGSIRIYLMTGLKLIFYIIPLLLAKVSLGQADFKHDIKSLREDFRIFREALEQSHAGIYWYRTKSEMDKHFEKAYLSLDREMTELEFFRIVAPLISKIGCGHTWIATSEPTQEKIWGDGKVLPLKLKFIKQKAYCVQNNGYDFTSIQPGDEIISINHYSVDSLLSLSNNFSPGDGFIETGKTLILDNVFNQFYTLYIGQPDKYIVRFKNRQGDIRETVIDPLPLKEVEMISARRYPAVKKETSPANIVLKFINENSAAVLKIKEFADWELDEKRIGFKNLLKECFHRIDSSKTKNLIIDLRDNDGGNEKYGLFLYSFLTDRPFTGYKQIDFRTTRFSYKRYTDTRWFEYIVIRLLLKHKKMNDSTYLLTNDKATKAQKPNAPVFKGKIYVLINRGSFSTTSDFTALAHSNGVATFVGEETGGSYAGNTSNYSFLLTLPSTKVRVNIPIARYQTNVTQDHGNFGRGTIPHIEVMYSLEEHLNGVDKEMETVFSLLKD